MKKIISSCLLILFAAFVFTSTAAAQDKQLKIGKIFGKEEANQLFGKPVFSIAVKKDLLKAAVAKADKYVLLSIKGKFPVILNQKRMPLAENNVTLDPGEKAYVFSKEVVEEFLNGSTSSVVYFELRGTDYSSNSVRTPNAAAAASLFTVSDSYNTLELSFACPPWCP